MNCNTFGLALPTQAGLKMDTVVTAVATPSPLMRMMEEVPTQELDSLPENQLFWSLRHGIFSPPPW